jgi:PRC-barrel domain
MDIVLLETLLLPLADAPGDADRGPSIRAEPRYHELRFRRRLSEFPSTRAWWLDVAVFVRLEDPEQLLQECKGFLVDSTDNRPVGVVDAVETDEETGYASALEVAAGWFGRRRIRIPAEAIELVVPAYERIVVRVDPEDAPQTEQRLS